ncbi:MAG: hypothetical protein KJZ69_03140 [Phycisphaerales bacterium]|nr:hypothetical protein [Phycisphaerales bacterium]
MPISGLVLTISPDARMRESLLAALSARREISLGRCEAQRLAVATDTADEDSDRALWRWLEAQPGVKHIDLVFVHFDDQEVATHERQSTGPS